MQKTAYEMRISDWSSDVCSSDLAVSLLRSRTALMTSCSAPQRAWRSTIFSAITSHRVGRRARLRCANDHELFDFLTGGDQPSCLEHGAPLAHHGPEGNVLPG